MAIPQDVAGCAHRIPLHPLVKHCPRVQTNRLENTLVDASSGNLRKTEVVKSQL